MITLKFKTSDFESADDYRRFRDLVDNNGLVDVRGFFLGAILSVPEYISIIGNSAQVVALLLTLYQMYGHRRKISYHSDQHDVENIDLDEALKLAEKEESEEKNNG